MKIAVRINTDARRLAAAADRLSRDRPIADAASVLNAELAVEQALAAERRSPTSEAGVPDGIRAIALARAARRLAGRGDA